MSPREREVVQLVCEGKASKEIATILNMSLATAETHRSNILGKLNLHSIAELVLYAVRNEIEFGHRLYAVNIYEVSRVKRLKNVFGTCLMLLLGTSVLIPTALGQKLPSFGNVVIVLGENQNYTTTYNSKNMPYLTSLAKTYGLGVNYYSDSHPSIGNYFNLTAGYILTDDDDQTPESFPISKNNIALEVQKSGGTWKDYVESLPSVKNCGGLNSGTYYVRHDPLEYMTTINKEKSHYVCFSRFAKDLANHDLPTLSWLVPNGCDDAHDCSIGTFDTWLKKEIKPLVESSYFQPGGNGLLIIVFDENADSGYPDCSTTTEGKSCGGQVELVVVSPFSKKAYKSHGGDQRNYNKSYDAGDILRLIAQGLGLPTSNLGWADKGLPMADFFSSEGDR